MMDLKRFNQRTGGGRPVDAATSARTPLGGAVVERLAAEVGR
jgi:hypothetical protein